MPSDFFPEEHSKAWWPCRSSLSSALSPVVLGHWSVCRLRTSLSSLLLGLCLGKFLRLPWVLRRQAWIPGSPLPRACQVEVEAKGWSELWWSVWSWGQRTPLLWRAGRPSVWRLERLDRVSLQSRSLFNLCLHLVTYSFNCFLGVGITYGRSQCMPRAASSKRKRDCRDES